MCVSVSIGICIRGCLCLLIIKGTVQIIRIRASLCKGNIMKLNGSIWILADVFIRQTSQKNWELFACGGRVFQMYFAFSENFWTIWNISMTFSCFALSPPSTTDSVRQNQPSEDERKVSIKLFYSFFHSRFLKFQKRSNFKLAKFQIGYLHMYSSSRCLKHKNVL